MNNYELKEKIFSEEEIKEINIVKGEKRIIPFMNSIGYNPKSSYCKGNFFQALFVKSFKSKVGFLITCNGNTIINIEVENL